MSGYLILSLEAPTMSFGGETIDKFGVVRDFPAKSMLTGLIANALGYERHDVDALDALQSRLVYAVALVRPGRRSRDYQTARLFEKDAGWTTHGELEGRSTSPSYNWDEAYERARGIRLKSLTHERYRDFDADARTLIALTLEPSSVQPTLGDVAEALERPARPLFIGRKPNLPSRPILTNHFEASDPIDALVTTLIEEPVQEVRVQWTITKSSPSGIPSNLNNEGAVFDGPQFSLRATRRVQVNDERRHRTGVHSGSRETVEGVLSLAERPDRNSNSTDSTAGGKS